MTSFLQARQSNTLKILLVLAHLTYVLAALRLGLKMEFEKQTHWYHLLLLANVYLVSKVQKMLNGFVIPCHKYIKMGKTPAFSVINGFRFPRKPPELDITEMEERLISPRIPFMQLMEKPRGGQKSLRGNVVNVPADVNETVKSLPRTLADTETIQVKLKIKQNFKHHVFL